MPVEWSEDVDVAVDADGEARRNVVAHRERVVCRLLSAGLSAWLLRRLLPDWTPLIDRVATTLGEPSPAQVTV